MSIEFIDPTNEIRDYQKFFVEGGDKGFSPERNKAVIEKTIKDAEKLRLAKRKDYIEQVAERVEAAMSYARHLDSGNATPAERYFGKKQLAELQGRRILEEVEGRMRRLYEADEIYLK